MSTKAVVMPIVGWMRHWKLEIPKCLNFKKKLVPNYVYLTLHRLHRFVILE